MMVQGVNKEYIFHDDNYKKKYLEIINSNIEKYKIDTIAYCVMSNHAHFLMYVNDLSKFGNLMHNVNLRFSNYYNKKENRCGVVFRNRYKSEPIYDIKYLLNCIKYIHNNPVKAGMVSSCGEYKYSSYNEYISGGDITKTEIMEELFGKNCDFESLFKNVAERRFADTKEETSNNLKYYLKSAVNEFLEMRQNKIEEVLSQEEIFGNLVSFLKKECGFKYVEIQQILEVPKGAMDKFRGF